MIVPKGFNGIGEGSRQRLTFGSFAIQKTSMFARLTKVTELETTETAVSEHKEKTCTCVVEGGLVCCVSECCNLFLAALC